MAETLYTPEFRASYPQVFTPKKNDLSGKMEYSVTALFKLGEDLSKLEKAAKAAIEKKWGPDRAKWPKNLRSPFRDQADREKENEETGEKFLPEGYVAGAKYITLKSEKMPGIVDRSRQPIIDAEGFYAGCYAHATVTAYAYEKSGNRGVSFGLGNIQKLRDGEPFSGRRKAEDEFTALEGMNEDASGSSVDDLFK